MKMLQSSGCENKMRWRWVARTVFFVVLSGAAVLAGLLFITRGPIVPFNALAQTGSCDNSAADAEYGACKSDAANAKASCGQDCKIYQEDPCYGECEANYNQCIGACNSDFNYALQTCNDIYADSSVNCVNSDEPAVPNAGGNAPDVQKNNCKGSQKTLDAARKKVTEACKGISYPERLLTGQGREPNTFLQPLCDTRTKELADAKATLARAEKQLEDDNSQRDFQKMVLQNQSEGFSDLLDQFEKLQDDVAQNKAKLDEASEKFSEIKRESNIAWAEAVAGSAGPAGTIADVLIWAGKSLTGAKTGHISKRVGIDVAAHGAEYGVEKLLEKTYESAFDVARWTSENPKRALAGAEPFAFIGVAYDGLELQELKNITHEVEQEYNQIRGWYEDSVTGLESFKKRQDYEQLMSLEKKTADTRQKIKLLDIEIASLEKQIPVMKHTLGIVQELYDKCLKDKSEEDQALAQQENCRKALQDEQAAKKAVNDCGK